MIYQVIKRDGTDVPFEASKIEDAVYKAAVACAIKDEAARSVAGDVCNKVTDHLELVRADMSKPLPFADESFDLIFHPVSNCYVKELQPIWNECYRVLKKGGILLAGWDNGINYLFEDDDEERVCCALPFDPLSNPAQYEASVKNDWGIQFSHTIEEELDGQLRAGFTLTGIYGDTNGSGHLHELNVPTFYASRCVK